jgi:hypothetical protein
MIFYEFKQEREREKELAAFDQSMEVSTTPLKSWDCGLLRGWYQLNSRYRPLLELGTSLRD